MTTLTIDAVDFRDLLTPVLPMACKDDCLPVICAVLVEADGMWLSATTTDRYRAGIRRGTPPATITLTVEDDGVGMPRLTAEAAGLFDMFDSGRFVHTLLTGEFPNIRRLIQEALELPQAARATEIGLNPILMADFKACGSSTLRVILASPGRTAVVADDEGFIGIIQARSLATEAHEDWTDFLTAPPKAKKSSGRKVGAA